MKFLLVLAISAALMWQSDAVICKVCSNCNDATSIALASTDSSCSYCKTSTIYASNSAMMVSRSCADTCFFSRAISDGSGTENKCCTSNSCNSEVQTSADMLSSVSGISCYECVDCNPVTSSTSDIRSNCNFCRTTSTYMSGKVMSVSRSCETYTCSNSSHSMFGTGSTTECCQTNNCNGVTKAPNMLSSSSSSSGISCYECVFCNPVTSSISNIKSNCNFCQTVSMYNSGKVMYVIRSCETYTCSNSIVMVSGTGSTIECCQTSNCNGVIKNAPKIFLNPFLLFCFALLAIFSK